MKKQACGLIIEVSLKKKFKRKNFLYSEKEKKKIMGLPEEEGAVEGVRGRDFRGSQLPKTLRSPTTATYWPRAVTAVTLNSTRHNSSCKFWYIGKSVGNIFTFC